MTVAEPLVTAEKVHKEAVFKLNSKSRPVGNIQNATIFFLGLAIPLWYNLGLLHANCIGCCDASEYIRLGQGLFNLAFFPGDFWHGFWQCAIGQASAPTLETVRMALQPVHELHQAGPIFPLFLAGILAISGAVHDPSFYVAPVIAQSVLSALSCCMVASFVSRVWDNRVGVAAGLLCAIYPGFIVNSGRLYSESFATFLACALLFLIAEGFYTSKGRIARALVVGAVACSLQLTRSILVLFSVMLVPILTLQTKSKWKSTLTAFFLGLACIVGPWLVFQNVDFGKSSFLVDRVGNYNLFIGTNTSTQGWLTIPYPDCTSVEKNSLSGLLKNSIKENPVKFLRLMLDKPIRLFQAPWNDFRTPIGPFDYRAQVFVHQLILLFAGIGLSLAFLTDVGKSGVSMVQLTLRTLLLAFIGLHILYSFFITVPRYGLTAMPVLIGFAAAGLVYSLRLLLPGKRVPGPLLLLATLTLFITLKIDFVELFSTVVPLSPVLLLILSSSVRFAALLFWGFSIWCCFPNLYGYRRLATLVVFIYLCVAAPFATVPLRAEGRWNEWQQHLEPHHVISQSITLPAGLKVNAAPQAYLAIDADSEQSVTDLQPSINGKRLDVPVIPGMAMVQNYAQLRHVDDGIVTWEGEHIFDCLAQPAGLSNSEIRQWFFLPLPKSLLAASAGNVLKIDLEPRETARQGYIFGQLLESNQVNKSVTLPALGCYSWEKSFYGVETDRGLTDPRLDQKVVLPGLQRREPNIRLLIPTGTSNSLRIPSPEVTSLKQVAKNKLTATTEKPKTGIAIATLPSYKAWDLWMIRIRGEVRTTSGTARPNIRIRLNSVDKGKACHYESPWALHHLPSLPDWQAFDMSVPVSPGRLPGGAKSLIAEVNLDTPDWKSNIARSGSVEIKDFQLEIMKLPQNPLSNGKLY